MGLPVYACDPMVPLAFALGGANWIMASVVGVILASCIKCVSFPFFTNKNGRVRCRHIMFLANIVTSILGVLVVEYSSPGNLTLHFHTTDSRTFNCRYPGGIRLSEFTPLNKMPSGYWHLILIFLYLPAPFSSVWRQSMGYSSPSLYWLTKYCMLWRVLMGFIITTCLRNL